MLSAARFGAVTFDAARLVWWRAVVSTREVVGDWVGAQLGVTQWLREARLVESNFNIVDSCISYASPEIS